MRLRTAKVYNKIKGELFFPINLTLKSLECICIGFFLILKRFELKVKTGKFYCTLINVNFFPQNIPGIIKM